MSEKRGRRYGAPQKNRPPADLKEICKSTWSDRDKNAPYTDKWWKVNDALSIIKLGPVWGKVSITDRFAVEAVFFGGEKRFFKRVRIAEFDLETSKSKVRLIMDEVYNGEASI